MRAEQLQAAQAAHWRQAQSPLLTLDDAESWLGQHPLCLYLPRRGQLPAPAPSFVEACLGQAQATPSPAAIEPAQTLLARLVAAGSVVALNLLGSVGEQPDFLAHREALPCVLALRAGPDWKHAPRKTSGHQVSPLVLELWKILDQAGVLSAAQAREAVGREITEAAVLRALCELWQALRISPVYPGEPGQPVAWEMLRLRHREALAAGGSMSQVTALSLLVSMYLQSVYAATSEEIEVFLSPLASRSRVREAVRGLSATRQIHSLSMDARTYYFLEGGLPELAELPAAALAAPAAAESSPPEPGQVRAPAPPRLPAPPRPSPRSGSAPIVHRPAAAKPRPPFAAAHPAARAEQRRPGSRPAWAPAAKPQAGGGRRGSKQGTEPGVRETRPRGEARPAYPAADRSHPYSPASRGRTREGARPGAKGGPWAPGQKRETAPRWARPGSKAGSAPRPSPGGVGDRPFAPHGPRGRRGPEVPSRTLSRAPDRPSRPFAGSRGASRPAFSPGPPAAPSGSSRRPPNAFRSGPRPGDRGKFASGGRPRGERPEPASGRESGPRSQPRSGPESTRSGKPGPGKTGRPPFRAASAPPSSPPSFPRSSARPSPDSRPASFRPSGQSGFGSRDSGKPGSFGGRKPDRKPPGFKKSGFKKSGFKKSSSKKTGPKKTE